MDDFDAYVVAAVAETCALGLAADGDWHKAEDPVQTVLARARGRGQIPAVCLA